MSNIFLLADSRFGQENKHMITKDPIDIEIPPNYQNTGCDIVLGNHSPDKLLSSINLDFLDAYLSYRRGNIYMNNPLYRYS